RLPGPCAAVQRREPGDPSVAGPAPLQRRLRLYYGRVPAPVSRRPAGSPLPGLGGRGDLEENLAILRLLVQHPYSVAFGFTMAASLRQYLGDPPAARSLA